MSSGICSNKLREFIDQPRKVAVSEGALSASFFFREIISILGSGSDGSRGLAQVFSTRGTAALTRQVLLPRSHQGDVNLSGVVYRHCNTKLLYLCEMD